MSDGLIIFLSLVFIAVALLSQGLIVPVFGESRQMRKKLHTFYRDVDAKFLQPKNGLTPWRPGN